MINRAVAESWSKFLNFPHLEAAMIIPFEAATPLRVVTAISLATMTATAHAGALPMDTKNIKTVDTRSLSLMGSRSFPRLVTVLVLLARIPSKRSVRAARQKATTAIKFKKLLPDVTRKTIKGMEVALNRVSFVANVTNSTPSFKLLVSFQNPSYVLAGFRKRWDVS